MNPCQPSALVDAVLTVAKQYLQGSEVIFASSHIEGRIAGILIGRPIISREGLSNPLHCPYFYFL